MTLTLERESETVRINKSVQPIQLGLEKLLEEGHPSIRSARVGLICNQASVDHGYHHAADLLHEHPDIQLQALFGPQHGIRGEVQDNMIETEHGTDRKTGLPVHSLYSETREPTEKMLEDVDVLVADVLDEARMRHLVGRFNPAVIFHAAAHKHIALAESNVADSSRASSGRRSRA